MTPELFLLLAVFHGAIALITTSANLYIGHRRQVSSLRRDSANLKLALAAELANLRDLYKDNIDAIYSGKEALASCRMFSVIYRGNLGRLHTLAGEHIAAIVTAFAMSERVEALAAVHCKAHGANAFSMGKDRPYADALVALYEKAAAAAERALKGLGQDHAEGAVADPRTDAAPQAVRSLAAAR